MITDPPGWIQDLATQEAGLVQLPGRTGMSNPHLHLLLITIGDAIREIDQRHLEQLAPEKLSEQCAARRKLYGYVDQLWADLKADGLQQLDPLTRQCVAGLRDIANGLRATAEDLRIRS